MRKITLILTVAVILLSCTGKKGNEYKIAGIIKGSDVAMVYLQKMDTTGWVTKDSAVVKNGEFEF